MRSAITLLWEMLWEICKYKKVPSLCLIKKSSRQLILHHLCTICICNFVACWTLRAILLEQQRELNACGDQTDA